MRKLPVAGPTYDYRLENIRNSIIEEELALCLKKRENVYTDEDVQIKYTSADGTEYTFGQVTEDTVSLQTDITALQSSFTTLDGEVTANATAVSGLETRVTSAEGSISSNATAITSLTTTVGTNTTNITTNTSSINGIEGKYAVKINNNGHVSGFGLISTANNATPTSTFTVTADAFKIVDTSGAASPSSPFQVYTSARVVDGVTVPAGVYMENANITSAQIKTLNVDVINIDNVTLDTSGGQLIVKTGGVNTAQIASNAVSTIEVDVGSSVSMTSNNVFNTVATTTVNGIQVGDKFMVLGRVQFFTGSGMASGSRISVSINFGGQTFSDILPAMIPNTLQFSNGVTLGGIFTATASTNSTVSLLVAGGTSGGTGTLTVNGPAIYVQKLVR